MADILDRLRIRLRDEREARGVSQAAVGACCRPPVGRGAVYKWESGENKLPVTALEAYEQALGVPVDIIVGGTRDPRQDLDAKRRVLADEFLAALRDVPDEELDAVRVMLRAFRK